MGPPGTTEYLIKLYELLQFGMLSLVGGIANYLYYNQKNSEAFTVIGFLINCVLSFFIGMVAGDLLPDSDQKYGLIMVAGFCCYPLLNFLEYQIRRWIEKEKA